MTLSATWQLYDGAAERYERHRPEYHPAALNALKARLGRAAAGGRALDAGAGTGIFSRLLLRALPELEEIECVEPNEHMVQIGRAACSGTSRIRYTRGFAEALPATDGSLVLVTAATAAHWFDRKAFFPETLRVLEPGGVLALFQNKHRYWDDPLAAEFASFKERCIPGYRRGTYSDFNGGYAPCDFQAELRESGEFETVTRLVIPWERHVTPEAFRGFCYSMGHIKKAEAHVGAGHVSNEIDALIARHLRPDGRLVFAWATELTMANACSHSAEAQLRN